jgi:hypothetical protein
MTSLSPDNAPETVNSKDKVDTNLTQHKVETNLKQEIEQPISTEAEGDPNWKAFREARKVDRLERQEAEKKAQEKEAEIVALKAAMEAAFSKSAPSPQAYQQYYNQNSYDEPEETEDQRIEKKVNALLNAKEEKYRKEAQEREQKEYPNRLMKDFPDFNSVVSQENLDYIDYHYPELSRPMQRLQDGYDKWADTYRAIKKFVPNHGNVKKDSARADLNQMKPKSIASASLTQSGDNVRPSINEVEQTRASNWARMQKVIRAI